MQNPQRGVRMIQAGEPMEQEKERARKQEYRKIVWRLLEMISGTLDRVEQIQGDGENILEKIDRICLKIIPNDFLGLVEACQRCADGPIEHGAHEIRFGYEGIMIEIEVKDKRSWEK